MIINTNIIFLNRKYSSNRSNPPFCGAQFKLTLSACQIPCYHFIYLLLYEYNTA